MTKEIKFSEEIRDYSNQYVYLPQYNGHTITIAAYEVTGSRDDHRGGEIPCFGPYFVESTLEVDPTYTIYIKWDGCSDLWMEGAHQCSIHGWKQFYNSITECYKIAENYFKQTHQNYEEDEFKVNKND